jgi:cytochrome oxidase Cu insertion factor (SCO1/SenC/PrrC family)/thiol-disulfide isomerase/thioredoxin
MSRRGLALALLTVILALLVPAASALADGDPGSDVLVYQDLFVGSDAGLSVGQQAKFEGLLQSAAKAGFPIRVAIISSPTDLGAVTELWRSPGPYARFLGIELSLSYKQRLLVVMPNGFGFNWPGHTAGPAYAQLAKISIAPGGPGLLNAAQAGVQALAAAAHVKLSATGAGTPASGSAPAASAGALNGGATASGGSGSSALWIVLTVVVLVTIVLATAWVRRRSAPRLRLKAPRPGAAVAGLATLFAVVAGASIIAIGALSTSSGQSQTEALASNPDLDPGTPLARTAPDFTLSDQFGRPVSLRSYRGKVVILAFTDSVCTTICPMTTTAMVDAKAMLGAGGSQVQLLGVDANPAATSLEDVWSYSELHGLLHEWHFLTGSSAQLRRVWKDYSIEAAVAHGEITHTPALFVIAPDGSEAKVYVTQGSYSAIGQLGQILAQEAARLLPGHPKLDSSLSYAQVPAIPPTQATALPKAGGGTVPIGSSGAAHLYMFFATWDQQVTSLAGQLSALDAYQTQARSAGLPQLTAVDEGSVEPTSAALTSFLAKNLPHPLNFPVAVDRSGRLADGYEVQGVPWFVLTSPSGQILWYWEVDTGSWLSTRALIKHVRAALARAPAAPTSLAAAEKALAGSPAPLAALHRQAATLLGSESALAARIKQLRGYPIVINAWASWCPPCRSEFGLFAAASGQYGRKVAFLGADTEDSAGDARSFLAQHPVSYPSYQAATTSDLSSLAVVDALPTTIFINPVGKVVYVHVGQYDSQGTLDEDVATYSAGS